MSVVTARSSASRTANPNHFSFNARTLDESHGPSSSEGSTKRAYQRSVTLLLSLYEYTMFDSTMRNAQRLPSPSLLTKTRKEVFQDQTKPAIIFLLLWKAELIFYNYSRKLLKNAHVAQSSNNVASLVPRWM